MHYNQCYYDLGVNIRFARKGSEGDVCPVVLILVAKFYLDSWYEISLSLK